MIKKILASSLLLSSATLALHAHALEVLGTKEAKALSFQARPGLLAEQENIVSLMKVKLSKQEIATLNKAPRAPKNINFANAALPTKAILNFEKFPVLDQGMHGACVTFASAAAFNYLLDKPDHVSALCSLELGETLESNGYYPSGWDGSFGPIVLDQFMRFGYISTAHQHQNGCAGVKNYPANSQFDTGKPMALSEYKHASKSLIWEQPSPITGSRVFWKPIVTVEERFYSSDDAYNGEQALTKVKQVINSNSSDLKNIATIGFLLYGDICHAGACAKNNAQDDTWAMTRYIKDMLKMGEGPNAGHEVTIIGYDDNAIAVDRDGTSHKGLLTIRNSWGSKNGDKGNYYMTYDYFKTFVDEVQKVSKVVIDLE